MRIWLKVLFVTTLLIIIVLFGCTENQRARSFGGTVQINLPAGQKLETATWKETNLWYLTRQMRPDERPETHTFIESSSFGMVEGKVIFIEHK